MTDSVIAGKCKDGERCPYVHDRSKVAVCRLFLKGSCRDSSCPLAHNLANRDQTMPVCRHFLRGVCTDEGCPYAHVHVNSNADVCPAFLRGFCPAGQKCKLKHAFPRKRVGRHLTEEHQ